MKAEIKKLKEENLQLIEGIAALNTLQLQYRKGLTDIVKHVELMGGGMIFKGSATYRIAMNALKK